MCLKIIFFLFISINLISLIYSLYGKNIVQLDHSNFIKVAKKFPYVVIRFDNGEPLKHNDSFVSFSSELKKIQELIFVRIKVSNKQTKKEEKFMRIFRFKLKEHLLPKTLLYKHGNFIKFKLISEDLHYIEMIELVKNEMNIPKFRTASSIPELDKLIKTFYKAESKKERNLILEKAIHIKDDSKNINEKQNAQYYIEIMKLICKKGMDAVKDEVIRRGKMLKDQLTKTTYEKIQNKLTLMLSFVVAEDIAKVLKDEL